MGFTEFVQGLSLATPMDRKLQGGHCQSPAKEGALFSGSLRIRSKLESKFGKQEDQTVRENESQSQWGERVDEYLCPRTLPGCRPQVQQTQRWALGSAGILGTGWLSRD